MGRGGTFLKKGFLPSPNPYPSASKDVRYGDKGEKAASVKSLFCMGDMDTLRKKSGGVHVILLRANPPLLAKKQSQNIITPSIKRKGRRRPGQFNNGLAPALKLLWNKK